jgi:hypothetical protein
MNCPTILNPRTGKYISSSGPTAKRLGLVPNTTIPKILWCFWNSAKLPTVVNKCIESWKIWNPNYSINIINLDNIKDFIPEVDIVNLKHADDSFARLSDFIRLHVLYKYGGFWVDASTFCTLSFDTWMKDVIKIKPTDEFIGFYNQQFTRKKYIKKYPIIESWFFACKKKSQFVKEWRDEFMKLTEYEDVDDYIEDVENDGFDTQLIEKFDDANYLAIHVSAQVVLQSGYPRNKLIIMRAEGPNYGIAGPIQFWVRLSGNTSSKLKKLCDDPKLWSYPIIKLVGDARDTLEKNKKAQKCIFNKLDSEVIKYISNNK